MRSKFVLAYIEASRYDSRFMPYDSKEVICSALALNAGRRTR